MHGTWTELPDGKVLLKSCEGWEKVIVPLLGDVSISPATLRRNGNSFSVAVTRGAEEIGAGIGDKVWVALWLRE